MFSLALYLVIMLVVRLHFLSIDHTSGMTSALVGILLHLIVPNASFHMCIDFFHRRLDELRSILLKDSLMHMHDVTHQFCVECHWVAHMFLKFKVLIAFQFFPRRSLNTLICHVVHVLLSIEILLVY